MKARFGMAVTVAMALMVGSVNAQTAATTSKRFFLDKNGGGIEVGVNDPQDTRARDQVRQELRLAARDQTALPSPAVREHQKEITYRYEQTDRGGRIRVSAKSRDALRAVQAFLHSQISGYQGRKAVAFSFIQNTSLVVVPVMVNNQGPYRFLLDTGASNSILSVMVADSLKMPRGRTEKLFSAGGDVAVTIRMIDALEVGEARLKQVEIAVANFNLLETLQVDGILGSDYLRRFKVSIDYDSQVVQIEPCCPESISMLVA
jgi:predicted aspartyl protease